MMQQIWNRLQLLTSGGSLEMLENGKAQVKILDEEVLTNVDHVMPFGFAHGPRAGAKTHIIFPSGDRSYGIALVVGDKRYQMQVQGGEVALHDDNGTYVHLKDGDTVYIKSSNRVIADCPNFETTGDCKIGGKLEVTGDITAKNNVSVTGDLTAATVTETG